MQGKLTLAKLNDEHEGYSLSVNEGSLQRTLCVINGNFERNKGPVALLSLNPHIVYGMSHPKVINRIMFYGPQIMLSTKELAHRLYEHGMKGPWWKIKVQKNTVLTALETFYTVNNCSIDGNLQIVNGKDKQCALLFKFEHKTYLISNRWFELDSDIKVSRHIVLEDIKDYLHLDILGK